jgi:K+-sensing histidine kinase KdpD
MKIDASKIAVASQGKTSTFLFVVDAVTGNPGILDFACKLAERQNARLHLLHVVDLEHTHSSPDAQMGAQFSLEMHAQRARTLKTSTTSLLSFGSPATEIPRRAVEVNASLVVLPLDGAEAYPSQQGLVQQLRTKCDCPVLALPADLLVDAHAVSLAISGIAFNDSSNRPSTNRGE